MGRKKGCTPWNKGTKGIMKAWNKGKKHSEEAKQRMSESQKGRIAWNKGIEHTAIQGCKNPN